MGDINRFLIFLILIGLLYALYKYQNIIYEQFEVLQTSISGVPPNQLTQVQPVQGLEQSAKPLTITNNKITADNISQVSIDSLDFSKSEGSGLSLMLDNDSADSAGTKGTYGSLFE
jgi:hypothetical protein